MRVLGETGALEQTETCRTVIHPLQRGSPPKRGPSHICRGVGFSLGASSGKTGNLLSTSLQSNTSRAWEAMIPSSVESTGALHTDVAIHRTTSGAARGGRQRRGTVAVGTEPGNWALGVITVWSLGRGTRAQRVTRIRNPSHRELVVTYQSYVGKFFVLACWNWN